MNTEITPADKLEQTRMVRIARAVTWMTILTGALGFWTVAGWLTWAFLRP